MNVINQNKAYNSCVTSLESYKDLIDSRTLEERLCFLGDFSEHINFFNESNKLTGNWQPFLYKDPMFLMASIIKTEYFEMYNIYVDMYQKVNSLKEPNADKHVELLNEFISKLTTLLISLFKRIESWTYYMSNSKGNYSLKSFVINEVTDKYSGYLWAVLDLKEKLVNEDIIKPIKFKIYKEFDLYDEFIWKHSKNQDVYWKILDLAEDFSANTRVNFFEALSRVGGILLDFLKEVIKFAKKEFKRLRLKKTSYPDTVLLRSFVDLMDVYKDQLNGISKKHLKFYFDKILKQSKKSAVADSVFICASLDKKNKQLSLPKSTLFDGGVNSKKKPIVFETINQTNLTSTEISQAYTLSKVENNDFEMLVLNEISDFSKVKKDKQGAVQKWDTFGVNQIQDPLKKPSNMGFSFGSPMLYLKEGLRQVTINLGFDNTQFTAKKDMLSLKTFEGVNYYISSETGWIQLTKQHAFTKSISNGILTINFTLKPSDPSLEKFKVNPDGISCSWPMFKMVFTKFLDLTKPPILKTLDISVDVSNLKSLDLYNSNGTINSKKPFQIFGPSPTINSEFIIGSREIFSKPYTSLLLHFDWGNLPKNKNNTKGDNFKEYYLQYNNYLNNLYNKVKVSISFWDKLFESNKTLLSSKSSSSKSIFKNTAFTVDFLILENGYWSDGQKFTKQTCKVNSDKKFSCTIYNADSKCDPNKLGTVNNLLFSTDGTDCNLIPDSFFKYKFVPPHSGTGEKIPPIPKDPNIQNTGLKYSSKSTSGFLKMNLTGPNHGFGNDIYAKVVSAVTLYNAAHISRPLKETLSIISAPNTPFSPVVNVFSVDYTANYSYTIDGKTKSDTIDGKIKNYPLQCFSYSPFQNYVVYDTNFKNSAFNQAIDNSINTLKPIEGGIALFPEFNYKGALFLGLKNVSISSVNNVYFFLSQNVKSRKSPNAESVKYAYLSKTGWKSFDILSDGTSNFSCEGIVKFDIKNDISLSHSVMPSTDSWISIAVEDEVTLYSQTAFLKNNGIALKRTGTSYLRDKEPIELVENTIKKSKFPISSIASVVQPFSSREGKGAETLKLMNKRVSTRLKIKDRIISSTDYFRALRQEFSTLFFTETVYNKSKSSTNVFALNAYDAWTLPNAFAPSVSSCMRHNIKDYLISRISPFANIIVKSFELEYVYINAVVSIASNFELQGVKKDIKHGLDIYLSPWIKTTQAQRKLGENITVAQIVKFIKQFKGVTHVKEVYLESHMYGETDLVVVKSQMLKAKPGYLFVSSNNNGITCKSQNL